MILRKQNIIKGVKITMNKKIIASLIMLATISLISCRNYKSDVNMPKEVQNLSSYTNKDMESLYTSNLETIENIFKSNSLSYEVKKDKSNKNIPASTTTWISFDSKSYKDYFNRADYKLNFDKNGEIIAIILHTNVGESSRYNANRNYEFRDSEFYKFHKALAPDIDITEEVNKKFTEIYKNISKDTLETIEITNGNIKESFTITKNKIDYTLIMYR